MNRTKIFALLLLIAGIVTSCGGKKVVTSTLPDEDAATAAVVMQHYDKEVDFETLQGRLRVHFQNESRDQSVTVSFRMEKNDTIWMSGQLMGFPLAKLMITPQSVQFYEKISGTYFDGDFRFLSNLLGTPLDFEKIQNLLIGQAIYDLRDDRYILTESTQGYQLQPAKADAIKKLFLLDAGNFKVLAEQIAQQEAARSVTIEYPEYQILEGEIFPKEINIIATEGAINTKLNLQYRSIEFNVPVSFPFAIPKGYEEMYIE